MKSSGEGPALEALDDKIPGGGEGLVLVGQAGLGPALGGQQTDLLEAVLRIRIHQIRTYNFLGSNPYQNLAESVTRIRICTSIK